MSPKRVRFLCELSVLTMISALAPAAEVIPAENRAAAGDSPGAQAAVKLFEARDLDGLQKLRPQSLEGLPLDQRNRVALAAAKSLGIEEYLGAIKRDEIPKHFTKPPAQDSPAEAECRKQWGINTAAAELLQHLAGKRLVNDSRLLPHLIAGLDHPDRFWVGQKCYYALGSLARHESGSVYWSRMVEDPKQHAEIVSWWKNWWDRNKDRHPVFDEEVEKRAREEVLRLARVIEEKVKPGRRELALFTAPRELPLRWQVPFFDVNYSPALLATPPLKVARDRLPWLDISCRFQSADLPPAAEAPSPPPELKGREEAVYSKVLDGTDLIVEVLAASKDSALIKDLAAALAKAPGDSKP